MIQIEEQIDAMAAQWPGFKVIRRRERQATWEGRLAPDKRNHVVRVSYRVPLAIENVTAYDIQPLVQVIEPKLEQHPDYELGPIPHVYWDKETPDHPYLCLFSPELGEWSVNDLIAHTTIFWAVEWLYFYEGWLLTKRWQGGGRHVVRPDAVEKRLDRAPI